ncbi:MAG: gamma-glutamyltransferase [Longimicrobiales bacterium]|nr:gamma-glutamyltransferase [Longimicrobiales bacterium]
MRHPSPLLRLLLVAALAPGISACSSDTPRPAGATGAVADHWPDSWRWDESSEPVRAERGIVVTTDAIASEVGIAVLREGGNAVDAAIAVHFALAVVNPEAGNIGGGGFMVARMHDGEAVALDFREKAPAAATADMYLDARGNPTDASVVGHRASGVPGSVRGMWDAHLRFGTLDWARLVEPAIALAGGFEVRDRFLNSLDPSMVEALQAFPASAAQFLPAGGQPPAVGDTLRQPDLAATLTRIRDRGADGFYRGETARLIVEEMARGGGLITAEDLAGYTAAWRDVVETEYRGYTLLSMPPSSSGGVTMAEAAEIYELAPPDAFDSDARLHRLAEAFRRAYADRNHYLADPDFIEMPLEILTSEEYARFRSTTLGERATPSGEVEPGVEAYLSARTGAAPGDGTLTPPTGADDEGEHTTHYSIVDRFGNAVSVTTTINSWYGSKVTVTGAGFVLNNEMDDFTAKPGVPNQFGLVQGERNAIAPGKRMLSAMTPTIVLDPEGALFMVTGTPGGSTIITTVFQTISNLIDHGMNVSQAVLAPRAHHQHLPDQIFVEPGGFSPAVLDALRQRGHTVVERGGVSGDVQAIRVLADGTLEGQSDPRRGGRAIGY